MPKSVLRESDLVLAVQPGNWDGSDYDLFLSELCGERIYQQEAVSKALEFVLGRRYHNLRELAEENFHNNENIRAKYRSLEHFLTRLQFPDKLSASLDLAMATGKSYVLYALAMILLAEGAVDAVLVLCPSLVIEAGLTEKFNDLATDESFANLLPAYAKVRIPNITNASSTITRGSICIENYHAILENSSSSVRESLQRGLRVAVLNDEAHHVANEPGGNKRKWKEFIENPAYNIPIVIGVSGTCYVRSGKEYFADVIYRYSLRNAITEGFIKDVEYVIETSGNTKDKEKRWQIIVQAHNQIAKSLEEKAGIRPMSIIVTADIKQCDKIGDELKSFLVANGECTADEVDEVVHVIHSRSMTKSENSAYDDPNCKTEWVVAVSMLNEGWDVKRVFMVVPHEKRAFESRLLILQVLGRGLRKPTWWRDEWGLPVVTILNHDAWTDEINNLVYELLEMREVVPSFVYPDSRYHFSFKNLDYEVERTTVKVGKNGGIHDPFAKGYVELTAETIEELVDISTKRASGQESVGRQFLVTNRTYTAEQIANDIYKRFDDFEDENIREYCYITYPPEKLVRVVQDSLYRAGFISKDKLFATERVRQTMLGLLNLFIVGGARTRYTSVPKDVFTISTDIRPQNSERLEAFTRKSHNFVYISNWQKALETLGVDNPNYDTLKTIIDDELNGGFEYNVRTYSEDEMKTPLAVTLCDSEAETAFVRQLISNRDAYDAWIKSTSQGFLSIRYYLRRKRDKSPRSFNPDFIIKIRDGQFAIVEIKDESQINNPDRENIDKYHDATKHFATLNKRLGGKEIYYFHFLTPSSYGPFFEYMKNGRIDQFKSKLDAVLEKCK